MADEDDFFALPPFKPDDALVQLRRDLRAVRGLSERGGGFDWKGLPILTLAVDGTGIRAQAARKPARSPDWDTCQLKSGADVRRWLSETRQRIARWDDDD